MGSENIRRKTRFAEIVVRVIRSKRRASGDPAATSSEREVSSKRNYDALIYSTLTIPDLTPASSELSRDVLPEIADLPLIGCEQITISWNKYREYVTAFMAGQKEAFARLRKLIPTAFGGGKQGTASPWNLRNELFEPPSPALRAIFRGEIQTDSQPLRVWWGSRDPQLAHLPWELLAYGARDGAVDKGFSFVRGVPAAALPRVPVSGPLRVAFIHEPNRTPPGLIAAVADLAQDTSVQIVPMTDPPFQALQIAVREGYEIIHLVADGTVSLAQEGILYLRKAPSAGALTMGPQTRNALRGALHLVNRIGGPTSLVDWLADTVYSRLDIDSCAPSQLSGILSGSRVTILCLSPTITDDSDAIGLEGLLLPSVYKAFARLGASAVPLPTIVAPLVATTDSQLETFWRAFYANVATSHSVESAVTEAAKRGGIVPAAVFLRHRLGREFIRGEMVPEQSDPSRMNADLQAARELLDQLKAIDSKYKRLSDNVTSADFLKNESARQEHVEQQLESFTSLKDDER